MKRLQCVVLAAILVLGSVGAAGAVDVKVKGTWDFTFGWTGNFSGANAVGNFQDDTGKDDFSARNRFRTQANFIVSEQLQGVLFFEIGTIRWGDQGAGGALDTDGTNVKTKHAYVDWAIPSTEVTVRMGLQPLVMPNATKRGNPVLNSDVAAAVVNIPFNDQVGLTLVWARPWDVNDIDGVDRNIADEMDILSAILSLKFDGVSFTPWLAYSSIGGGSNFFSYTMDYSTVDGRVLNSGDINFDNGDTMDVWWAGFALEVNAFDPLTFGIDFVYGHAGEIDMAIPSLGITDGEFETSGWYVAATVDYKLDWGSVGAFGWYATGDDYDDVDDGEFGHLPAIGFDSGFGFGSFGYGTAAAPTTVHGSYGAMGQTSLGTWGLGIQAADWSFVDKLSHTLRFVYYRGTNDADIVRELGGPLATFSAQNVYLTDEDQAFEVDFLTKYQIYENLTAFVDLAWVKLDMDEDVWGDDYKDEDAWKASLILRYAF
jgi:hypothetical protein